MYNKLRVNACRLEADLEHLWEEQTARIRGIIDDISPQLRKWSRAHYPDSVFEMSKIEYMLTWHRDEKCCLSAYIAIANYFEEGWAMLRQAWLRDGEHNG